ncbi:hypothetical protein NEMBOFW57_006981 [Staphylotrichum longicolle]|uniref:Uncharacterized protein n=1 Tax=Staphylotrichum longicolle TaxID=669026 RepID=A0AAD4EUA4_9PEZI|nr:hypothetical protein NEMBOFW57_006981 [Staphylotrichum longicolle]
MHPPTLLTTIRLLPLLVATAALALPLNINLGAYSPALVVGDGAISFEGAEEGGAAGGGAEGAGVAQIVNALQGAAVSGGAAAGNANAAAAAAGAGAGGGGPGVVQAAAVPVVVDAPTGILDDPTAALPTPGSAKDS